MLIKNKKSWNLFESDVTPEGLYLNRRKIIQGFGVAAAAAAISPFLGWQKALAAENFTIVKKTDYADEEELNSYKDITTYNNYYEFGTSKSDPARNAHTLISDPWSVKVSGEAEKTGIFSLEDVIDFSALEERIYRHRCVEAWSMVMPWVGVPLADVLKKFGPTSNAKFVAFDTLADPKQMPGLRSRVLDWPYTEGLRIDEAMHPLSFMVVGLYGKPIPNQNGAPIRLVVPWKYGFKSIKSIVSIRFQETQPVGSWEENNRREYGFYSNVNPDVDHPRWSQSRERRIGEFFKRATLIFNGYGEEVASLYAGMDLQKYF